MLCNLNAWVRKTIHRSFAKESVGVHYIKKLEDWKALQRLFKYFKTTD